MKTSKLRAITDYDNLDSELKAKLKLDFPYGFGEAITEFINNKKKTVNAIRWETSEKIYMIRISKKMLAQIMEDHFELNETS